MRDIRRLLKEFCEARNKEYQCAGDCCVDCALYGFLSALLEVSRKGISMSEALRRQGQRSIPRDKGWEILRDAMAQNLAATWGSDWEKIAEALDDFVEDKNERY